MLGMGFVDHWASLIGLRLVLGIFEVRNRAPNLSLIFLTMSRLKAGFFPGVVYLLSTWYTRYEVGKRYAAFYLIGCVASAFGGILAFGLMQMEGVAGESMNILR